MTDLKTLKDFEFDESYTENEKERILDAFFEIKQEAIKRFKYWIDFKEKQPAEQLVNEMQILGRLAELRDFFNITEEDLK